VTLKLGEVRTRIWRWMHEAVALQQRRINRLLARHYELLRSERQFSSLNSFYQQVRRYCHRVLDGRSQRGLNWVNFQQLLKRFPPRSPSIAHPLPRSACRSGLASGRAECGKAARSVL
jgi:hypothetical protein